jgi:hypothetical protein
MKALPHLDKEKENRDQVLELYIRLEVGELVRSKLKVIFQVKSILFIFLVNLVHKIGVISLRRIIEDLCGCKLEIDSR